MQQLSILNTWVRLFGRYGLRYPSFSLRTAEACVPPFAAFLLLVLLTGGAVWAASRGWAWCAVGWFWFSLTALPTVGLVEAGFQVMADRFLYLPQTGLCIALVWSDMP